MMADMRTNFTDILGSPAGRSGAVDEETWSAIAQCLAEGLETLLDLWGSAGGVHMALLEPGSAPFVVNLACSEGRFPSVGASHPPAIRLERAIRDLFGYEADGLKDTRPWLDHGRWGVRHPLGECVVPSQMMPPYTFLPANGEGLHQIAVGPVHAGIIEPGHFRFSVNGEAVARLEERLGYVHKGIEGLMRGADIDRAARIAGRISGDSALAYGFAFARAVESALGIAVPPRARWLRALMAELERMANHLGDIGAICNDAAFALMLAHCGILRERVLRVADSCFGHRLMRDVIVPGGVAVDLTKAGADEIGALVQEIGRRFPQLIRLYDETASLQDRTVGTGVLHTELARRWPVGGYVGRASGRDFDARRNCAYPPYDTLRFTVPVLREGDVNARVWIRILEVEQSLDLVGQLLEGLPDGAIRNPFVPGSGEGMGLVEGFRGEIFAHVRLDGGRVAACRLRDPSWFQWPLLEAVIENNIVADFPLCNKSFNCSYSGHDL